MKNLINTLQFTVAFTMLSCGVEVHADSVNLNTAIYDATTQLITIPTITVGNTQFGSTTLHFDNDGLFSIGSIGSQGNANSPSVGNYDAQTGLFDLTSVSVANHRYTHAKLQFQPSGKLKLVGISDPIPVRPTSYENSKTLNIPAQILPVIDPGFSEGIQNGYAFGDFFQDGAISLVAFTEHTPTDGAWPPRMPGKVNFFKKGANGDWIDQTASLLSDTSGCILPRKLVVADFNNDDIPDIFAACSGLDSAPYSGENYRVLLSQSDGTYQNVMLPFIGYAHGASAADVNGDGNVDIAVADMQGQGGKTPIYFLMGDGAGSFTLDYDRVDRPEFEYKTVFWTVELIPDLATNSYKLFAGGTEPYITSTGTQGGSTNTYLISSDSQGNFATSPKTLIPVATGFQTVMDTIVNGNTLYVLRVQDEPFYGGVAIQKVDLSTGTGSIIYTHTGWYPGKYLKFPEMWFSWMVPYENTIQALNGFFNVSIPQ